MPETPFAAPAAIGVYVHVPFCASTCDFCAFYQEAPSRHEVSQFLDGIERELAQAALPEPVNSVFIGGGTPGVLIAADLSRLARAIRTHLRVEPQAEWTIELAPSTVKPDKLAALREAGVNRVSLGAQSFSPRLLQALGRRQGVPQIRRAYQEIRDAGFTNVNIDLMFAVPGQSLEDWRADLREAVALDPEHLSTYCLTFEEDTALWVKLCEGKLKRSIDHEEELYRETWRTLPEAGFAQYEVSNFGKPGHACRHNLNTWRMGEWRGFGPSAASQYHGQRFQNEPNLKCWRAGVEKGSPALVETLSLSEETLAADSLIFGLRMNAGVDLAAWRKRFANTATAPLENELSKLAADGMLRRDGERIFLSEDGRLLADAIGARLLI